MNPLELRYEIFKSMAVLLNGSTGVQSFKLVDATPADPHHSIEVITDDPFDLQNANATRRYRVTIEEIT